MRVVSVVAGTLMIAIATIDTVGTLVATRIRTRRWWPTAVLYRYSWAPWRGMAKRIEDEDDRESFLSVYGPLSLLMLLVFWAGMQVVGWGLVWWGMRNGIPTLDSLLESVYYSGVAFFTIGFGDVVPVASAPRILVVIEGFFGVATMALLIGFLPTLFAAYSSREELVSTLDDLSGERVTPIGMIEAYTRDGDASELYSRFERWEEWTASVLESHSSYPMLMLFRSKQSGQSWIAAMVVVTETAALCISIIDAPPDARALRLCRRTAQTVVRLKGAMAEEGIPIEAEPLMLPEERLQAIYNKFGELGFPRRPLAEARERLDRWHAAYIPELEALIRRLLIPREFRLPPAVTRFSND